VLQQWLHGLTTQPIGLASKQAIAILSCPIEYISDAAKITEFNSPKQSNTEVSVDFDVLRVISLINLMKIDGRIALEEVRYISACIEQANISQTDKMGLIQAMGSADKIPINYSVFANDPEESVGLLIDLTALAKRDGNIHLSEKLYIKHVGALLGFSESDIEEMIASS
jgi:uncharacterized tellurite resistance protein B-like protein